VRNHLQNVFRKLDVMNRAQAVFEVEQLRGGF
jgi:DNA-binding CsgD family transcriptional regulator